jgi:hypothetical protein
VKFSDKKNAAGSPHRKKTTFISRKKEDYEMEVAYDFDELTRKAKLGLPLNEQEISALQGHRAVKLAAKQQFDFGEIEGRLQAGRMEEMALRERNARWAKAGPSNSGGFVQAGPFGSGLLRLDDCRPAASSPQYMGPFFGDKDGRGVTRMLDKFHVMLKEIKETGRLIV